MTKSDYDFIVSLMNEKSEFHRAMKHEIDMIRRDLVSGGKSALCDDFMDLHRMQIEMKDALFELQRALAERGARIATGFDECRRMLVACREEVADHRKPDWS